MFGRESDISPYGAASFRIPGGHCESARSQRYESTTSPSIIQTDNIAVPGLSDPSPAQQQEMGESQQLDRPSSDVAVHADENERLVIMSIRATDLALGLRRVPAGFFVVVHHSGLEWRTENKPTYVNPDVVEWTGPIPLLPNRSATVCLEVCASFECQPILGDGEQLQEMTITVEQLLAHSARSVPFTFLPKDDDVVSPCSSVLVTVEWQKGESSDSLATSVLSSHRSTIESLDGLGDATNRGHSAISRYRKSGEKRDLERSITEFERALNICPLDHPCRAAAQSNLAMARSIHCRVQNTDTGLPLSLYRTVLGARPVDHVDRPSTLIQLALVHLARFDWSRDRTEGAQAERLLHEAVALSSADSHQNRAAMFMLQLYATRRTGPVESNDHSSHQVSTSRLTDEDLAIFSMRLLNRFERFGDLADMEQGILILKELVRSTPVSDQRYYARLVNLGVALWHRFKHLGNLADIEDAISTLKRALDITPYGHPHKPGLLNRLGNSILIRFQRLGELRDLEDAISMLKEAADLTPHDHPDRAGHLNSLGASFKARFSRLGNLRDLEVAISALKDTVDLTPPGDPHRAGFLNNLGNTFRTRYDYLGELRDLEDAILILREAVDLTPHDHPDKPVWLDNLGINFRTRFERLGEPSDLDDAISLLKDAVDLTPHGHPEEPHHLNNLGTSLFVRFERFEELSDLEGAILALGDAVDLTPEGHPQKPVHISNLGNSLLSRFERFGELRDLEVAISRLRDAVNLTRHGDPDNANHLNNLAASFRTRFERLGEPKDLEEAISTFENAIHLIPNGHPRRPTMLSNLGNCFRARFERFGGLKDLEDAISILEDSADLTPHGHPDKPGHLNDLSISFRTRFDRLGELRDLEVAISRQSDAVDLTPDGHPDKPAFLNNLGTSFRTRFDRFREPSDIEVAILKQREAVNLTPHDHPDKPGRLNNLGNSLKSRFEHLGELVDLEDAISTLRDAVELTPHGHPDRPSYLNNLGSTFFTRFSHLQELADLEVAISSQWDAVNLVPRGHPDKPAHLNNLANSFRIRFQHLGELRDLEVAISLYSHAASAPFGPIRERFRASQKWISFARLIRHRSLLHACSVAINLLPQLAWIGLSLTHRLSELTRGADVVREAAAAALEMGFPEIAVEWLERGRSIVWGELFQLRGSYEELSSSHPDHARRLQELSTALNHASVARERYLSALSEGTRGVMDHAPELLQEEANRQRALAIERDQLLREIRSLPGFKSFLLHRPFSQLRLSAHAGPVVILNAAESRCDALIVLADVVHAIHVPLPTFTFTRSTDLRNTLNSFIRQAREGQSAPWGEIGWEFFLSPLWKCVVKPVLDALAFSAPGDLSRVFWCPTGPLAFLPIHAAGLYDGQYSQPGHKVFDFVISSYVPTLSILAPSPNLAATRSDNLRLLVVRQPPSDGLPYLRGVVTESEHIRTIIGNSPSACTSLVQTSVGTVEEVLDLLKDADWCHFACHGIQDTANPTNSGLCLADGRRLKVRDIIAVSRPHGGLAFLSACQTAMGEERLSDEAIHIAAGMLFAGYGGVIGTMWSISDSLAPEVAKDVYEHLFQRGTRPDYREAARALHEAIGGLRDSGVASFDEWVPFIHVGL